MFDNAHQSAIFPLKQNIVIIFLFGSVLLLCKQSAILCGTVCMAGCMTGFCYAKEGQELSGLVVSRLNPRHVCRWWVWMVYTFASEISPDAWVLCVAMGTRINNLGRTVPRRLNMGLGLTGSLSLAEARDKARELRKHKSVMVLIPSGKTRAKARQILAGRKDLCRML